MPLPAILSLLYVVMLASASAASEHAPLFADDTVLDVRIEAPIGVLMDVRPDEAYLKGTFAFTDLDGAERRIPLKLRTRGNYRRDKAHCDFAPIRLNFPKGGVRNTLLQGQDKLKLVTHCQTYEFRFEFYLLREYLAYRLFAELSDISYGTRLLRITYFDTEDEKELTRFGFVIEDDKAVAKRNDLKTVNIRFVEHEQHVAARQNLVHVFEYMIGNTEYSLVAPEPGKKCCHNMDLLSATKEPPFVALPYDFDFSGLVQAAYAGPNPKYPIKNVRTRYYKGRCSNNELVPETLELFLDKRDALFAIVDSVAAMDDTGARATGSVRSYLERFFDIIDDPEEVKKRLVERCLESSPPDNGAPFTIK